MNVVVVVCVDDDCVDVCQWKCDQETVDNRREENKNRGTFQLPIIAVVTTMWTVIWTKTTQELRTIRQSSGFAEVVN